MKDKVQKIREEVERLKNSCASPIVICDTLLSFIDSLQEEPSWLKELQSKIDSMSKEELQEVFKKYEKACNLKEEPVSDDLGDYINELSKQFPEVSFAKLSRIAVRVAKWQKQQMMKDAIEAEIINWASMFTSIKVIEPKRAETMIKEKFDIGDKVKLIIIKED